MGGGVVAGSRRERDAEAMSTVIEHTTTGIEPQQPARSAERVELAERTFDGISVALYWTRGTNVVAVTVDDTRTGDSFELVVAENERALDVFHHPFAYARARGMTLSDSG
jgi:hypothetical protein